MPWYLQTIFRSIFGFAALLFVCRATGKKFDNILGYSLGALAAVLALDSSIRIASGLVTLATWTVLLVVTKSITLKSYSFRNFFHGKPSVIIEGGQILEKNLRKSKLTINEMMMLLREKDVFKLSDAEFGVLENDGQLSVMKKAAAQPMTPTVQGIRVENESEPRVVMMDGEVLQKTLDDLGYSQGWLQSEIMKQGATDFKDVFFAQVDSKGTVYADLYQDTKQPQPVKSRLLLLASLKGVAANLETFALQTTNETAKQEFAENAKQLAKVIDDVAPLLRE